MGRRILLLLALAVFGSATAQAQGTGRVVGTVTADGRPIGGATITIVGTSRAVVSDSAGRFSIAEVPSGARQAQVRLLGYGALTQSVTVADGETATISFELIQRAIQLEGVVTVGYGETERARLTGSISTVSAQQLGEVATSDPIKALQGRVAGVEIVAANNLPGAAMNIRIRGVRSVTASNEPLIVVDGIPLAGGIGDFSPANVESIDILKDAAATAIYGSRGANGVVIITTKMGSREGLKTEFTSDLSYGNSRPLQLVQMMNMDQYVAMLQAAAVYAGTASTVAAVIPYPEMAAAYAAGQQTDWQRAILRTGKTRDLQLGMSGMSGNTRFNLSGNFFDQEGLAIGQAFNRVSGSAAVDHTMGRLRMGLTATGARSLQEVGAGDGLWGYALSQTGFGLPYNANGALITRPDGEPLGVNPLRTRQFDINEITRNRIFASAFSAIELMDGVTWRVNFGPDITTSTNGHFQAADVSYPANSFARASIRDQETFAYTLDNVLSISKNVGFVHHFDGTLLYGIQKQHQTQDSLSARNLPYNEQLWYALNTGSVEGQYSSLEDWALESMMGRVSYSLKDKYTVMGAVRRDGSSRLADGNKWAVFPSLGISWQIGDESFMQRFGFLNSLKLRASYGVTGNTAIQPYQTQGALSRTLYNFGAANGFGYGPNQGNPPNKNLSWEKTYQRDIGIDFGIFGDRVSGTLDTYSQSTKDLIMRRTLPTTSGYSAALQNIGETSNTGLELQLSTLNVKNWHGVLWTTDFGWAHNKNEIVRLATSDTTGCPLNARPCDINNGWFVGQPININADGQRRVWYDYKFDGIWQIGEEAAALLHGSAFKPGEIRLKDINGDGRITPADRTVLGNTFPDWTGSIYNRVTFRRFDFAALATIRWGYTLFDGFGTATNAKQGRFGNVVSDYWTATNPSKTEPAPRLLGNPVPYSSTRGYLDGSHWRVRNITFGYAVPERMLSRVGVTHGRLYFTAQDPFFASDYKGYDPENGTAGGAPAFRTLLIGASLGY